MLNIGNNERLEGDLAELDQLEQNATGFRRYALKTQQGQNRVLAQYRAYLRAKYKDALPAEATDADVDAIGFPEPVNNIWQPMIKEMRQFVILVAKHTPPRNKKHRHVSYTALINVAERLVFWAKEKFKLHPGNIIPITSQNPSPQRVCYRLHSTSASSSRQPQRGRPVYSKKDRPSFWQNAEEAHPVV